jgi:acetyl esterase
MADFPEMTTSDRLNGRIARSLQHLPATAKAQLAGRPIVIDGQQLDTEVQLLLAARKLARDPELHELTVDEGRVSYRRQFGSLAPPPERVHHVEDLTLPGPAGPIAARWYSPSPGDEPLPMLVHYHGGGHVTGDPDTCDTASRMVTRCGRVAVLSIDYRMGPEHPMPAPFEDALAAFQFAATEAHRFGVDPNRIAVGGDSAGGTLGAAVAQATRDGDGPRPAFQWLLYPGTDSSRRTRSRDLFGQGFLLTDPIIEWFREHHLMGGDPADVRVSPVLAEDLSGLPPAYVATGGFDPLRDEGEAYAARLREAGVRAALQRFSSLPHAFANLAGVSAAAREAMLQAVGALCQGLAAPAAARNS